MGSWEGTNWIQITPNRRSTAIWGDTSYCWGLLVFLRSLSTIHTPHQSLEQMHWFEAIFEIQERAVFEAIVVKGWSRLNFEAAKSKFCYDKRFQKTDLSDFDHSVPKRIWIKGSYLSQWLPQGERGPPKESKSRWIEILHGGSH